MKTLALFIIIATLSTVARGEFCLLRWSPNTEPDLSHYNVYRGDEGQTTLTRINGSEVTTATFSDYTIERGRAYRYAVTAVDFAGNESGPSEEERVVWAAPWPGGWTVVDLRPWGRGDEGATFTMHGGGGVAVVDLRPGGSGDSAATLTLHGGGGGGGEAREDWEFMRRPVWEGKMSRVVLFFILVVALYETIVYVKNKRNGVK